jgi:riboflavin synthase
MFTGLVREVGVVRRVVEAGDRRIEIACARPAGEIAIGASICCSGACLTVVETGEADGASWFAVEVSAETGGKTTLGDWVEGTPVNLEPSLRVGDELGGHIVSGHVDGMAEIVEIRAEGDSHRLALSVPAALGRYVAPKGSVALDGISLTVNEVEDAGAWTRFGVNIIPHTWSVTSLRAAALGTRLNFEADVIARYVARLTETAGR